MLRVENVAKRFGAESARAILENVSLNVDAGEYVAIMGESGSGKSTLLNLIAGLDVPDQGKILIDGEDVSRLDDSHRTRLRRARLGFVFQAFHLLPHLTVERNVGLPLALNGVHGPKAQQRIDELLSAVGLQQRKRSMPATLSGGEMQRVALARALVHRPRLVLADEPTGNLDAESAQEVLALLAKQLRQDGAAGILVTHSTAAAQTADRAYRLARGSLNQVSKLGL
jgi:putative ABC transport system ATP-binding protein